MALTPGISLGPYEVTARIGAGGMGEVYRARDTQLGRDVALKVLPEVFVSDPDRVARFQREAKTLAALNHPNIGGIHGLQSSNGISYPPLHALSRVAGDRTRSTHRGVRRDGRRGTAVAAPARLCDRASAIHY